MINHLLMTIIQLWVRVYQNRNDNVHAEATVVPVQHSNIFFVGIGGQLHLLERLFGVGIEVL